MIKPPFQFAPNSFEVLEYMDLLRIILNISNIDLCKRIIAISPSSKYTAFEVYSMNGEASEATKYSPSPIQ
jgi:hypothetical protein